MNFDKISVCELRKQCKEKGVRGYSNKKKDELVELLSCLEIKDNNSPNSPDFSNSPDSPNSLKNSKEENPYDLFKECRKSFSCKEIATRLNLAIGTVQRWIELQDVPSHYIFDLYKLSGKEIHYSNYSYSQKDQFFTPTSIVQYCWKVFQEKVKINLEDYTFIEPSAGDGSFLQVLPSNSISFDIEPRAETICKMDYLLWNPEDQTKKYIVFGNPPFGLRGHQALHFINHSFKFADYVCFILPQLFESDGKGSPRKRVIGYNLIHSEPISGMFYNPDKQEMKIHTVFQIWSKYESNNKYKMQSHSEEKMKIYSLSDGGTVSTTRNKKMIDKCDIYLPSTCFGKENMRYYNSFEDLPNRKGYGVVFFSEKDTMIQKAKEINWNEVSFLSTNSAYNLRTSLILSQFL